MKKYVCLFLVSLFSLYMPSFAEEDWGDFSQVNNAWDGQEVVTDKDFEDAINVLEDKKNQSERKKRVKLIKKIGGGGTSLHSDLGPDADIKELSPLKKNEDGLLLNVPVNVLIDGNILDKGYYKIFAKKNEVGDLYLWFYQSQFFKGKIRASITDNDYGEADINFVKLLPYNDHFVKIIYGSLDYNAYAYVRFY